MINFLFSFLSFLIIIVDIQNYIRFSYTANTRVFICFLVNSNSLSSLPLWECKLPNLDFFYRVLFRNLSFVVGEGLNLFEV